MKRSILMGLLLGAMLMAAVPMGCLDNDKSFVILFAVPPTGTTCELEYQDTESATFRSSGLLDLNFSGYNGRPFYIVSLQAHNYLLNDASDMTLNSKDIMLERFEISYRWMYGRELLDQSMLLVEERKIELPASGTVGAAAATDEPGKLLITLQVLPPEIGTILVNMGQDLADSVVLGVKVKIIGTTLGGTRVETNEFVYPLNFCWGCLDFACSCGGYPACRPGQDSLDLVCECDDE